MQSNKSKVRITVLEDENKKQFWYLTKPNKRLRHIPDGLHDTGNSFIGRVNNNTDFAASFPCTIVDMRKSV